ncbi:MAG: hypothetical protein E7376_00560 [Clostridiales bacterium]|nr:hypothetical protein [Clostridiales bacterium]
MEKATFIGYVESIILPLFTGSTIAGEEESSARDSEVALGAGGTVLIKPSKNDEYRLILKRNLAFKTNEVALLKSIIAEISNVSNLGLLLVDKSYLSRLNMTAIEKAICEAVTETASQTLLNIVTLLDSYSSRTYEGKRIDFGIIINESIDIEEKKENLHYKKLFNSDFFAVLSNGVQSCVEFDKDGYFLGHMSLEKLRFRPTICSYDYISFARYCDSNRIGVVLDTNGDILIFKNRSMIYSKKRGVWNSYCHDEIITLLSNRTSQSMKEIRKSIYFTSLDVSFANTGGCLAYLNKLSTEQALSHIDLDDILTEKHFEMKRTQLAETTKKRGKNASIIDYANITYQEYVNNYEKPKTAALKQTIAGRKFHELNRKLREELASVDGATIVDYDGTIIACGAIVRIEAGSAGGGRLAATNTLAKYGVAVKISQDGIMQAFMADKKTKKVKEIFTVG